MTQTIGAAHPEPPSVQQIEKLSYRQRRFTRTRQSQRIAAAWMVTPAVALLLVFIIIPIVLTFALAFTNAKLISPTGPQFVGIDNFTRLFGDALFWKSLRNTLLFTVFVVPFQAGLALVLALLINVRIRGVNFFRTVYFLPVVTSMVVVSLLWKFMYQPDGLINGFLAVFGIDGPDWLGNPNTALIAVLVMSIWQAVGFHMVIWLSGLQTIPQDMYEAGAIDGAGNWQRFRYITWPALRQTRTFILITITIQAFALFTQIQVMTQGGPLDSTSTIVYQSVRIGFSLQQTGYASALSLVFFVLVLAVSLVQRYLTRDKDVKK
ncbi:carbohydrate ABC transporter permease [Nakamurella sp.]|uniref:carbohydrate ABC transporter permease n=1 Tax=Nakamurella sp. TaxID=1869182 RepID=UPI0037841B7D